MVSDAKSVASDVGETVAAIEGLRAIILGEDGEVEDRGPLARPGDAPVHQRRRDARSLGGFGDIELVKFDRGVGRLALGKLEIDGTHLDIAEQRARRVADERSEEHTSELQSLMRNSYAVFCLKKKNLYQANTRNITQ